LKALEESSLLQMAQNSSGKSYRFVWLRTFHHPVVVRVDVRADGIGELTSKTERFLATIKKAHFWELPTHETPATEGCDGSQWIIEGVKNGKYHALDRWTPGKGAVQALGLAFALGLAQMRIPKGQFY
jgi:hypothetical protein